MLRDRYRLTGTLEVGPIAILHRAEEIDTGRTVAIKVFHEVGRNDRRRVEVLHRPAPHGVARLELPSGFATVYDCDLTDDERLFLVTELVEGVSIAQLLGQTPPLAPPRALELAIRVGEALEAALNLGFLDLRIAPRDIVVLSDGDHVKLLRSDALILQRLGLADQLATAEAPERDARYASPEELAGLPATERSVVYRFGVLVYELLYGSPPFEGTIPARRRNGRVKRAAGQLSDRLGALPASLDRLLSRMLDPDPLTRPVSVTSTLNQLWDAACRVRAETPAVPTDATSLPLTVALTTQVRQVAAARRWVLASLPILIVGGALAVWSYVVGFHPPAAVPTPAVERLPPAPSVSGGRSAARVGDNATVPPGSTQPESPAAAADARVVRPPRGPVREVAPGARPPEVPAPPRAAACAEPEPTAAMVNPTPPPRAPVPLPPARPSQPPPQGPRALIPLPPPARPSQPPPRDPRALIPLPPPARPSQPPPQDPAEADPGAIIDWLLRDRPQISE